MQTITEIREAILALSKSEFVELKDWLDKFEAEHHWGEWDEQIEADSTAGNLDFLTAEAMSVKEARELRGIGWEGDLGSISSDRS